MAARLRAAGFTDRQLTLFSTPEYPKEGGLVAVYPGTSSTVKPLLLIAHIDVVEAKREDWTRDPFTLFEENGYFYARGVADVKSLAATWVDTLIRFKQQDYAPKRTVKVALTCGEEANRSRSAKRPLPTFAWKHGTPAVTARCRCATTRSTSWRAPS
jgi:acetylornithine deacetylase/succinyl-diaminopimelate desuccinylase-like protein